MTSWPEEVGTSSGSAASRPTMVILATGRDAVVENACAAARRGRRLEGRVRRGERRRWWGGIVIYSFFAGLGTMGSKG